MCPWALHVVSVHAELTLGHLRYRLTDVPPQSNSPSDSVLGTGCGPFATALVARDSPSPYLGRGRSSRTMPRGTPPRRRRFVPFGGRTARAGLSLQSHGKLALHAKRRAWPAKAKPPSRRDRVSGETARVEVFHWRTEVLPPILHLWCLSTKPN